MNRSLISHPHSPAVGKRVLQTNSYNVFGTYGEITRTDSFASDFAALASQSIIHHRQNQDSKIQPQNHFPVQQSGKSNAQDQKDDGKISGNRKSLPRSLRMFICEAIRHLPSTSLNFRHFGHFNHFPTSVLGSPPESGREPYQA